MLAKHYRLQWSNQLQAQKADEHCAYASIQYGLLCLHHIKNMISINFINNKNNVQVKCS